MKFLTFFALLCLVPRPHCFVRRAYAHALHMRFELRHQNVFECTVQQDMRDSIDSFISAPLSSLDMKGC